MFFCFSAHTKPLIDYFVSRLTNLIFSDWLILILGEFKIKSIRCFLIIVLNLTFVLIISNLASSGNIIKNFCTISFFASVPFSFFFELYFVIFKLSKELEQTDPYYINFLMTKGRIRDISCKPLRELKIVLLSSREVLLRVNSNIFLRCFTTSFFRKFVSSPRCKFTRHSLKNERNFCTMENELFLKFVGGSIERYCMLFAKIFF